jgi:LPXTG-motif cell wall-anchored protein
MQLARVGAFLGAVTAAMAVSVFAAAPAQAHTPVFTPGCEGENSTLTVNLKDYQVRDGKTNTVKVTVNGEVVEDKSFEREFKETYTKPGDVDYVFTVEVTAWDDPDGNKGWTKDFQAEVPACVEEEVPSESSSAAATTTTTTTAEVAPVTTTSPAAVVPVGEAAPLANTGASIAIPLVIGIVLLGGGVALLVVLRRRAARN